MSSLRSPGGGGGGLGRHGRSPVEMALDSAAVWHLLVSCPLPGTLSLSPLRAMPDLNDL